LRLSLCLVHLDLGGAGLGDDGGVLVMQALEDVASLRYLSLYDNGMTDAAQNQVSAFLLRNSTLVVLNLNGNAFTALTGRAVNRALKLNPIAGRRVLLLRNPLVVEERDTLTARDLSTAPRGPRSPRSPRNRSPRAPQVVSPSPRVLGLPDIVRGPIPAPSCPPPSQWPPPPPVFGVSEPDAFEQLSSSSLTE
jgi:hypothetical protein